MRRDQQRWRSALRSGVHRARAPVTGEDGETHDADSGESANRLGAVEGSNYQGGNLRRFRLQNHRETRSYCAMEESRQGRPQLTSTCDTQYYGSLSTQTTSLEYCLLRLQVIKPSKYFQMQKEGDLCTLRISEAFPEDEGVYKCIAKNPAGEVTTSANLRVLGKGEKRKIVTLLHPKFLSVDVSREQNNHFRFLLLTSARHGRRSAEADASEGPDRYGRTTGAVQDPGEPGETETDDPMVSGGRLDPAVAGLPGKQFVAAVKIARRSRPSRAPLRGKCVACRCFQMIHEGNNAVLLIATTYEEDTGTFTCRATTSAGTVETSAKLIVKSKN